MKKITNPKLKKQQRKSLKQPQYPMSLSQNHVISTHSHLFRTHFWHHPSAIEERFGRDQLTEIVQPKSPQILKIGIVGPPNVGKSTLINELAEYKVSAVSRKAQTTRTSVMGVYTYSNVQIVS